MRRSTRHIVLVIVPIAAAVAAANACASPYAAKDAPAVSSEAGSDSASAMDASDAGDAADALPPSDASDSGLAPTPGVVECFVDECTVKTNPVCCWNPDGGTTSCVSQCPFGNAPLKCDDRTDCAPGQVCCVGAFGQAACATSCNGEQLCRGDGECPAGTVCLPIPCRGKLIGECGPEGPYAKILCPP